MPATSISMRRAILSDIHGNLEALEAVLADAREQQVTEFYCLGDIVGYGPNPVECVDLVRTFHLVLKGSFEDTLFNEPSNYPAPLLANNRWTREQLVVADEGTTPSRSRLAWLSGLPITKTDGNLQFVHGSPREPLHEYVFPEDGYNDRKMAAIFACVTGHCFHGHTHFSGVFLESEWFKPPPAFAMTLLLPAGKMLCNVGSVGQPRDSDPRACYAILTDDAVLFRRVEYPVDETARKLRDLPWL